MFEIRKFHKDVYVDGTIVLDSDKAVSYLNLVAYSGKDEGQYDEVVVPDKTLTESDGKIIHYVNNDSICEDDTIYHASGNVASYGYETRLINPYDCIYSYNRNVSDLNEIFTIDFENNQRRIINRMIYLSILSNYELFMMDLLSTCYLRFPKVKESYQKRVRFNGMTNEEVIKKLKRYPYNDFDKVANLFLTLLNVRIPDSSALSEAYGKRNDIAHRYNVSMDGEMVIIPNSELENLVIETNKYVYELFKKVIDKMYNC